jgi:hypothetical protein
VRFWGIVNLCWCYRHRQVMWTVPSLDVNHIYSNDSWQEMFLIFKLGKNGFFSIFNINLFSNMIYIFCMHVGIVSYRKNLFHDASLINISWFSWGASSIYIQGINIYKRTNRNKEKNYLQKCMLDTGGVTHILTLVTEWKINILFENMNWLCFFCFPRKAIPKLCPAVFKNF